MAIAQNFKLLIDNKRVTHQNLPQRRWTLFNSPFLPKINVLASVPFRDSSVSPAPIEAEKNKIPTLEDEILLFSDYWCKAYKGKEYLTRQKINNQ